MMFTIILLVILGIVLYYSFNSKQSNEDSSVQLNVEISRSGKGRRGQAPLKMTFENAEIAKSLLGKMKRIENKSFSSDDYDYEKLNDDKEKIRAKYLKAGCKWTEYHDKFINAVNKLKSEGVSSDMLDRFRNDDLVDFEYDKGIHYFREILSELDEKGIEKDLDEIFSLRWSSTFEFYPKSKKSLEGLLSLGLIAKPDLDLKAKKLKKDDLLDFLKTKDIAPKGTKVKLIEMCKSYDDFEQYINKFANWDRMYSLSEKGIEYLTVAGIIHNLCENEWHELCYKVDLEAA